MFQKLMNMKFYPCRPPHTGGSLAFGITFSMFHQPYIRPATANAKYPQIYLYLKNIGNQFGIPFTSILVNKNAIFGPHRDGKNVGPAIFLSMGDFVDGDMLFNGEPVDCRAGHIFTPHDVHMTLPYTGDRITIIFYTHANIARLENASDWRLDS